jgi:hypothetical protein
MMGLEREGPQVLNKGSVGFATEEVRFLLPYSPSKQHHLLLITDAVMKEVLNCTSDAHPDREKLKVVTERLGAFLQDQQSQKAVTEKDKKGNPIQSLHIIQSVNYNQ